jgi:hypothetical protein
MRFRFEYRKYLDEHGRPTIFLKLSDPDTGEAIKASAIKFEMNSGGLPKLTLEICPDEILIEDDIPDVSQEITRIA